MSRQRGLYFAQFTDVHTGNNNLNGEAAKGYLRWALDEVEGLDPRPECILVTADLVCSGRRDELEQWAGLVSGCTLPLLALPANHDLWGEEGDATWRELVGPTRQVVDVGDLRIAMFQDIKRTTDGWGASLSDADAAWLDEQLAGWPRGRSVVAFHAPILEEAGDFHGNWAGSNAPQFLELLRKHEVLAMVTGHWHRVNEWSVGGVRLINTGALAGWQWTGIAPYWSFPVRPGYRLFHYHEGELRSFWRELASQECRPAVQANVVWLGPVHTGGPRPQVRPAEVFTRVPIHVHTCSLSHEVERVEWSLCNGDWRPMERGFDGIWQEWQAELDPHEFRTGDQVLAVRAVADSRPMAYDAVPLRLAEASSPPLAAAIARQETVFELFYQPK